MADATCPICKRELPAGRLTPTYPFCGPRCKTIDLGNWLGDSYVIPGAPGAELDLDQLDLDQLDSETLAALLREPS
jgi:endogenous inhibitor of DNA gyrase (YacG/DUF329 family)